MIEEIRRRLAGYAPQEIEAEARPRAAVLLPLLTLDGKLHIVLTKRSNRVQSHKGEISFPGGSSEKGDSDLWVTALRESHEEIGLQPLDVQLIGRLDDIITISSFHVTAYVGEIKPQGYVWTPQEHEVAEVLQVPIDHLLDAANHTQVRRQRNGTTVLLDGYRFGEHVIWGATGSILRNFLAAAVAGGAGAPESMRKTAPR